MLITKILLVSDTWPPVVTQCPATDKNVLGYEDSVTSKFTNTKEEPWCKESSFPYVNLWDKRFFTNKYKLRKFSGENNLNFIDLNSSIFIRITNK